MRSKTAILITFAISLSLLLSSCAGFQSSGKQKEIAITEESLRTGTDSLLMSFYENMPPKEVYEEQAFPIGLVLANKGASDIKNGKIVLSYDDAFLENLNEPWTRNDMPTSTTSNSFPLSIEGKSINNPEGETQVYSKNFRAKLIGENRQSIDASFIATACYDYQTKKGIQICIDPVPFQKTNKPCEMKAITLESQGAPVAITKVEPKLIPKGNGYELTVDIHFQNKGKGQIFEKDKIDVACGGTTPKQFFGFLKETALNLRLGSDEQNNFICSPNFIDLSEKDNFFRCTYKTIITETQPYATMLFLQIDYGYTYSVSTTTKVLKKISVQQ